MTKESKSFLVGMILLLLHGCEESSFLKSHWEDPIPEQGLPPAQFSHLESGLEPESCGTCHKNQFEKWKNSLHSKTISSGIRWQLHGLGKIESEKCFRCHSPLKETRHYLSMEEGWENSYPKEWDSYLPPKQHGLICASCHVRGHKRFGPPSLSGNTGSEANLPHGGYTTSSEFESSLFCKNCHESPETGKKINGKRMMETYSEWKSSDFASKGIQCQNCHMPNRDHEWKGIHDLEMVKQGLKFVLKLQEEEDGVLIQASITSQNIGHKFPSYAVPKVYVRLVLEENKKRPVIVKEEVIGRFVDIFLEKELYDKRLSPGETFTLKEKIGFEQLTKETWIKMEVEVDPGEMYVRMFQHNLENKTSLGLAEKSVSALEQALIEKKESNYILFTSRRKVLGSPLQ